jgi:Na+/melibiose symporter-like transporter
MATEVKHRPSSVTAATWLTLCILLTMICNVCLAERVLKEKESKNHVEKETKGFLRAMVDFLWESGKSSYEPVWPVSS